MIKLYTDEEFTKAKNLDLLKMRCELCNNNFVKKKRDIVAAIRLETAFPNKGKYCSSSCTRKALFQLKGWGRTEKICNECGVRFSKRNVECQQSENHFCSRSCAATFNNKTKKYGNRRSKLEIYLEGKLTKMYPTIDFHFNRKDAILSELDIFIPSLKLAFELNGIFHYEPIFGADKLLTICNNDERKFQACLERGIELCIIDTSKQKHFTQQSSELFLTIITKIIDDKLAS